MKCFKKPLFICICVILVVFICSVSAISSENNKFSNSRIKLKHQDADKPSSEEEDEMYDCGCKIVKSFFALPKPKKVKPYERRWPQVAPIPKPPVVPPKEATCDKEDGDQFYSELKKFFPAPKRPKPPKPPKKKKPSTSTSTKNGVKRSFSRTTTTFTRTITKIIRFSFKRPEGEFTRKLFDLIQLFKEKMAKDKRLKRRRRGRNIRRRNKRKSKPRRLTRKEILKKRLQETKKMIEVRNRKSCYKRIRDYMDESFPIPYKNVKRCDLIGRALQTCLI